MSSNKIIRKIFLYSLFLAGVFSFISLGRASHALAQSEAAPVRLVRTFELEEMNISNPAGLAYTPWSNTFHVVEARGPVLTAATDIVQLTPFDDRLASARISAAITDPLNLAVDGQGGRLLFYQPATNRLMEVRAGRDGSLEPATLMGYDGRQFGLRDPQGMTVDPANGALFVLDRAGPSIVRITASVDGLYQGAGISELDLRFVGLADPAGLAFDPSSGHLHVMDRANQQLYELSQSGQALAVRDLSDFDLNNPQGMVFAPSGDLTDDPGQMSLYLADSGLAATGDIGQIMELSFVVPPEPALSLVPSTLVQTIETFNWTPPSPDPAGIVYLPTSDRLLVSDSEVNEMPIYADANMFEATITGTLVYTWTTLLPAPGWSTEPTGVTIRPSDNHLFISDDIAHAVHELDPGGDGIYGTGDDANSSWPTSDFGSNDPEGITYSPAGAGVLYIADGLNNEIYQVTPGTNGIFDGAPPTGDDVVTSWDTAVLGLFDPEGVAYNDDLGHLYIIGKPTDTLFQTTISGSLVQTIDVSAANAVKPAGLAYAPSSVNPSNTHIYIAARGVDNDSDPNENDGEIYEMTLPAPPGGNVAPTANPDSASTAINTAVTLNVAANDSDPNGNLDPTTANTSCTFGSSGCSDPANGGLVNHGDGTFTYTPNTDFTGNDFFVYEICDAGSLCDTATALIAVFGRQTIYVSAISGGNVGSVNYADEDILAYYTVTDTWSMYVDGSDVGLDAEGEDIDAFHINPDGSILMSFGFAGTIGGAGAVDDWDIVRFIPTSTGETTSGTFELYFDGEDVELNTSTEDIDALWIAPDGRILVSTRGTYIVEGGTLIGDDEDLLAFTPTSLGSTTAGTWELYFDGSDVSLDGGFMEDLNGTWIDANGDIYLTTRGDFVVSGLSGDAADIFVCAPGSTGPNTSCTFRPFWDGLAHGFEGQVTNGVHVRRDPPVADFMGTPTTGGAPLSVTFTDLTTNDPYAWSWDFGDSGSSILQNPVYLYNLPGTYTVTLAVTNTTTTDIVTKTNYITVTAADLGVTKVDAVDPVMVGDLLTYTVSISNTGPDLATSVMMTDTLPASVNYSSATPDQGSCGHTSGVVTCNLGDIAVGAGVDVSIIVTPTLDGLITNTVGVSTITGDLNTANNNASEGTTIDPLPTADLSVSKVDAVDPVTVGDPITYTATVTNNGTDSALNVVMTDTLPASVNYVSATPDLGSCGHASGIVTCNFGDMANGASVDVVIVGTTTADGVITNNVSVSSDTLDPVGTNNSASEDTTVDPIPSADLSVNKVDATDPVLIFQDVTYTITVDNGGPETALSVVLTDTLPAGVTFSSATPDQGSCGHASGVVTCNLGDMANGASVDVVIVVTTNALGVMTNDVSVASATLDPVAANNSASEDTIVTGFELLLPVIPHNFNVGP